MSCFEALYHFFQCSDVSVKLTFWINLDLQRVIPDFIIGTNNTRSNKDEVRSYTNVSSLWKGLRKIP